MCIESKTIMRSQRCKAREKGNEGRQQALSPSSKWRAQRALRRDQKFKRGSRVSYLCQVHTYAQRYILDLACRPLSLPISTHGILIFTRASTIRDIPIISIDTAVVVSVRSGQDSFVPIDEVYDTILIFDSSPTTHCRSN